MSHLAGIGSGSSRDPSPASGSAVAATLQQDSSSISIPSATEMFAGTKFGQLLSAGELGVVGGGAYGSVSMMSASGHMGGGGGFAYSTLVHQSSSGHFPPHPLSGSSESSSHSGPLLSSINQTPDMSRSSAAAGVAQFHHVASSRQATMYYPPGTPNNRVEASTQALNNSNSMTSNRPALASNPPSSIRGGGTGAAVILVGSGSGGYMFANPNVGLSASGGLQLSSNFDGGSEAEDGVGSYGGGPRRESVMSATGLNGSAQSSAWGVTGGVQPFPLQQHYVSFPPHVLSPQASPPRGAAPVPSSSGHGYLQQYPQVNPMGQQQALSQRRTSTGGPALMSQPPTPPHMYMHTNNNSSYLVRSPPQDGHGSQASLFGGASAAMNPYRPEAMADSAAGDGRQPPSRHRPHTSNHHQDKRLSVSARNVAYEGVRGLLGDEGYSSEGSDSESTVSSVSTASEGHEAEVSAMTGSTPTNNASMSYNNNNSRRADSFENRSNVQPSGSVVGNSPSPLGGSSQQSQYPTGGDTTRLTPLSRNSPGAQLQHRVITPPNHLPSGKNNPTSSPAGGLSAPFYSVGNAGATNQGQEKEALPDETNLQVSTVSEAHLANSGQALPFKRRLPVAPTQPTSHTTNPPTMTTASNPPGAIPSQVGFSGNPLGGEGSRSTMPFTPSPSAPMFQLHPTQHPSGDHRDGRGDGSQPQWPAPKIVSPAEFSSHPIDNTTNGTGNNNNGFGNINKSYATHTGGSGGGATSSASSVYPQQFEGPQSTGFHHHTTSTAPKPLREIGGDPTRERASGGGGGGANHKHIDPTNNLFVCYLPPSVDDTGLLKLANSFGFTAVSAKVARHPDNNLTRGFGFVLFHTIEEATAVRDRLDGYSFAAEGKKLVVRYAPPVGGEDPEESPVPENRNIYVKGIPPQWQSSDLESFFSQRFGVVEDSIVLMHRGQSKCLGLVRFESIQSAKAAVRDCHGKSVVPDWAPPLQVRYSVPDKSRRTKHHDEGGSSGGAHTIGNHNNAHQSSADYRRDAPSEFHSGRGLGRGRGQVGGRGSGRGGPSASRNHADPATNIDATNSTNNANSSAYKNPNGQSFNPYPNQLQNQHHGGNAHNEYGSRQQQDQQGWSGGSYPGATEGTTHQRHHYPQSSHQPHPSAQQQPHHPQKVARHNPYKAIPMQSPSGLDPQQPPHQQHLHHRHSCEYCEGGRGSVVIYVVDMWGAGGDTALKALGRHGQVVTYQIIYSEPTQYQDGNGGYYQSTVSTVVVVFATVEQALSAVGAFSSTQYAAKLLNCGPHQQAV